MDSKVQYNRLKELSRIQHQDLRVHFWVLIELIQDLAALRPSQALSQLQRHLATQNLSALGTLETQPTLAIQHSFHSLSLMQGRSQDPLQLEWLSAHSKSPL